jgi:hypothetical protein
VTYATTTMGADHTAGYAVATNILGVGGSVDALKPEGQVDLSRNLQIATAAIDSTGMCLFIAFAILDQPETFNALVDMIGVSVGSGVTFDAKNIYFDISTLGILEVTGPDIGSVTMNVEFVPIPAALPLMLSGLAGLVLVSRRRKIKD